MNFRTDLAIEAVSERGPDPRDVTTETVKTGDLTITRMRILTPEGAEALGKPKGRYITAALPRLTDDEHHLAAYAQALGQELGALLPPEGTVLVVGLGNRTVTPDALGPAVADMVLATRHIRGEFARSAGLTDLRPVAVVAPGVLGQTGTESSELTRGVCREIHPGAVVVVDALAARSTARLGCTVQLCDTGISPGSGVGNNRSPLNRQVLGVPVIGLGVPTVVDAATLVSEMTGHDAAPADPPMMVTPREVDLMISRAARLLALTINAALQPAYSPVDLVEVARGL
ncbi:MAG: GPR endopeptidase [Ruminococcaceae bacterium]|nr:GPR endopeptidase [Oscillospiraceae bacterium]